MGAVGGSWVQLCGFSEVIGSGKEEVLRGGSGAKWGWMQLGAVGCGWMQLGAAGCRHAFIALALAAHGAPASATQSNS